MENHSITSLTLILKDNQINAIYKMGVYFQSWTIASLKDTNWTELAQSFIKALHGFHQILHKNSTATEETASIITCNGTLLSNNAFIEIQDVHLSGKLCYFFSFQRQFRIQLCNANTLNRGLVSFCRSNQLPVLPKYRNAGMPLPKTCHLCKLILPLSHLDLFIF